MSHDMLPCDRTDIRRTDSNSLLRLYDLASGRGSPLADRVIADLVSYGASGGTGTTTLAAPQNVTATAQSSMAI